MTSKFNLKQGIKKYYPLGLLFLIIFALILIQEAKAKEISVGTASDNIGIGTNAPGTTYRLNVNGNSNITGTLNVTGGITGASLGATLIGASNVSAGAFGSNSGGGNYYFPSVVGINATADLNINDASTVDKLLISGDQHFIRQSAKIYFGDVTNSAPLSIGEGLQADSGGDKDFLSMYVRHKLVILSDGYPTEGFVGIGTPNPQVKLDVKGKLFVDNSGTYTNYSWAGGTLQTNSVEILDRVNGSTSDGVYPTLTFHDYGNGGAQFSMEGSTATLHLGSGASNSAGTLAGSGGYFSKLKIWGALETTGSVGIGTSGPGAKLDVSGAIKQESVSKKVIYLSNGIANSGPGKWYVRLQPITSGNIASVKITVQGTWNYSPVMGWLSGEYSYYVPGDGSLNRNDFRVTSTTGDAYNNLRIGALVVENGYLSIPVWAANTNTVVVTLEYQDSSNLINNNLTDSGWMAAALPAANVQSIQGDLNVSGTISGTVSGTLNAANVSVGTFGSNTGGGNYTFPSKLSVGGAPVYGAMTSVSSPGAYTAAFLGADGAGFSGIVIKPNTDAQRIHTEWWTVSRDVPLLIGTYSHQDDMLALNPNGNVGIGTTGPGYKLDVAGDIRARGNVYTNSNYGNGLVGVYDSTRYQGIFTMGYQWGLPADGTSTGNLYGLAWSHPNAGGVASNLNTHGLLVMENGTFLAAISGSIRSRDDIQTPIFYDRNDTSFYVDPNSTSRINNLTVTGSITGNISNADTVDGQHFSWSNRSNGPTYVWAADSNGDSYLAYRPALSVSYASSAGSADSTNKLNSTGYGSGNLTYYQTSGDFDGTTGWSHYIIANHGDGASYYHYSLRLPFWGPPQYRRQTGSTSSVTQWYDFVTSENVGSYALPITGGTVSGTITAAGFIYNSDIKLKKNIATIESSLTKILQLRGVTFNWKKDNTPGVGLIAQEVEQVFPELVTESGGIKSVQYGNLVAPLIEAVKEQQKEIQSLNERIKVLEAK